MKVAVKALKKKADTGNYQAAAALEIMATETSCWIEDAKRTLKSIAKTLFAEEDKDAEEPKVIDPNAETVDSDVDSDLEREEQNRLGSRFDFSMAIAETPTRNPLPNELNKEIRKYEELGIEKWRTCKLFCNINWRGFVHLFNLRLHDCFLMN